MKHQQERMKYEDTFIIGKDHGKVVWSTIVWSRGPIHGVNMEINVIKMTIFLRGVEAYTKDVREMESMKSTRERIFTHVRGFYMCQDITSLVLWRSKCSWI